MLGGTLQTPVAGDSAHLATKARDILRVAPQQNWGDELYDLLKDAGGEDGEIALAESHHAVA